MANNRMFLVHRPTGIAVMLGKRYTGGWYVHTEDISSRVQKLFDVADEEDRTGLQDDYCIALESCKHGADMATDKFSYVETLEGGIWKLDLSEK